MNFDFTERQAKLAQMNDVAATVIVPGANMVYFTGLHFHLSERPTLAIFGADGQMSVIIPELEVPKIKARDDLEVRVIAWSDVEGFQGAFERAVRELGLKGETIGVDGQTMRVFEYHAFEQAGIGKISNVGKQLLDIRAIKTSTEVEAMRKAIQMSERALERLVAWVEPGMTEMAIGTELSRLMVLEGSVGEAFSPLIQTGPNSALPHGFMTERKLQEGEFLLIDFGGKFEGYPADITRTFCLGTPTAEMQKIYDAVLAANRAAIAIAAPGVSCGDVDKAARDEIVAAGYGEYFIHRTGHGLGLEGHELPQIAGGVSDTLQPGMVFTVEPGIYVPGLGGVRIEDDVAVTETGVDVLTRYPRQLMR
ncbi:MAG: Xaa-Pro peptidase family protein [Aggregatilineales bacterium]